MIHKEGGIQFLIKILVEGCAEAQYNAAVAICELTQKSQNQEYQKAIVEGGGIRALINVLQLSLIHI